jgi:transmembrane sensor
MPTTPNKIAELLEKYSRNAVSKTEFDELCALIRDDENEDLLKKELQGRALNAAFAELDTQSADRMLKAVLDATTPARRVRVMYPMRWVAAAAVIFLIVGGLYLFNRPEPKQNLATTNKPMPVNDIAPGGNKAILTLGNGQQLVLDSAQNGQLAVQGNVQVVKGSGTLAYNEEQRVDIAQEVAYNTVSTPKGGQYQVVLADGSKVWLNAASSLRFPTAFIGKDRRVEVIGEAYFEVAHNAQKPFIVTKGETTVQVLGTHFNVNSYEDEEVLTVTLLEGSVKTSRVNGGSAILKPGQQAVLRLTQDDSKISVVSGVNVEQVMAWKNGVFNFDNADLKAIMRQIARWYDVDVAYQGKVAPKTFKGEISRNVPASKVLQMLEYLGVHFKIEGKKIVVMP